jgi:hypothetical protein
MLVIGNLFEELATYIVLEAFCLQVEGQPGRFKTWSIYNILKAITLSFDEHLSPSNRQSNRLRSERDNREST